MRHVKQSAKIVLSFVVQQMIYCVIMNKNSGNYKGLTKQGTNIFRMSFFYCKFADILIFFLLTNKNKRLLRTST